MPALSDQNEPVAQLADRDHVLRVGEPDAGGHLRPAGARPEVEARDAGLGVLLREDVHDPHVLGLGHRALDGDGERHGVAVLDERGRSSLTLPGLIRAPPTTLRMASCISAGVARAGHDRDDGCEPQAGRDGRRRSSRSRGATCVGPCQSLNVIKKATTSSICCALRTGLPRQAGATRASPSDR